MTIVPRDEDYLVQLPAFAGPLDLLLQLIEREKLDINSISLAQVADQFLAHVHQMEEVQAELLADFLVIAVKLVWIKSRLLLPQPASPVEEEEEDPGEALARQLREYKRFKEAALALREIEERGGHTYLRSAPPPELERRLEIEGGVIAELLAAARAAFKAGMGPTIIPQGMVVPFNLTIHDQIHRIKEVTAGGVRVTFRGLLSEMRHRMEIIVTLLAVLELIKRRQINVNQDAAFGEIWIEPVEGVEISEDADDELTD